MASLTIMTGEQAGTHFELANRPLSVGRDPSRDIQVLDPKVSRKHAIVRAVSGQHAIAATKALNGILINGEETAGDTLLRDGDEILLGDTVLRFSEHNDFGQTNAVHHRKVADRRVRDANTMM
jgi:pSer/pThr/pTyr-binding forkhead associated (FHA) protein|tara:strand:- start:3841 stop:4209 length:369 start_codon:yes stop_codon:yes gene_type:complete